MKYKFKWYFYEENESAGIAEWLEDQNLDIPNLWINKEESIPNYDITNAILEIFDGVEFDCEYDDEKKTARIISVNGHELFFRPSVQISTDLGTIAS